MLFLLEIIIVVIDIPDCYISKRSQFLDISIKLNEYNTLLKNLVKVELYGIDKNGKKIHSKLIAILRKLNFPERYILSKIIRDYHVIEEHYYKERSKRILIECCNFTRRRTNPTFPQASRTTRRRHLPTEVHRTSRLPFSRPTRSQQHELPRTTTESQRTRQANPSGSAQRSGR